MKRHIEQWKRLGASDPYWAVLTYPDKRHGKWEKNEFFSSGEAEISDVLSRLDSLRLRPHRGRALDFGCGVGRLTRALASKFDEVVGVDVSEPMLAEARAANADIGNIEFLHNVSADLRLLQSGSFDFIYSNMSLQHNVAELQRRYIAEFCRLLRPGGILAFQTPSSPNFRRLRGYVVTLVPTFVLNLIRRRIYGRDGVMEVHWLSHRAVRSILSKHGVTLVDRERYDSAGPTFISYRYYGKRAP